MILISKKYLVTFFLIETQDRFSILARIYLVSFSEPLTANVPATAVERDF